MEILNQIEAILEFGVFGICVLLAYFNWKKDDKFLKYVTEAEQRRDERASRREEIDRGFLQSITELNEHMEMHHDQVTKALTSIQQSLQS